MDSNDEALIHAGVKGMKWGVRKDGSVSASIVKTSRLRRSSQEVVVKQKPGNFVKTAGGKRQSASDDAVTNAAVRQFAKKSTTDSLSTKQLQTAVNRMNLEMQYSKLLKQNDRRTRGQRLVQSFLGRANDPDLQKKAFKVASVMNNRTRHTKEPPMKRPIKLSIM